MHSPISNGLWVRARSTVLLYLAVAQTLGAEASLIAFGNSYSDTGQGANVAVHAALGITQVMLRPVLSGLLLCRNKSFESAGSIVRKGTT